jgi:hypothetical protein
MDIAQLLAMSVTADNQANGPTCEHATAEQEVGHA